MSARTPSPELLLGRVSRGDQAAMGLLYDALAPRLYAIARSRLEDAAAVDITAEVFVDLWRRARQYDPQRQRAVDWAAGIAEEWVARHSRRATLV